MELSMAISSNASHDSIVMILNKFHPLKRLILPKHLFGSKLSGQSDMRNIADYIMMFCTDAACICIKAEWEKFKASTKREPAFVSFTNW